MSSVPNYTEIEQCPTTRRDHPAHSYIRGRNLYRCRGRGVGSEPATTSSPDKGDVPEGQPEMPFAKNNATRYSFDFTVGNVRQLDVTKSTVTGKYGDTSSDVNLELRFDSAHAVSLKLTQAQFELLLRTAHPATETKEPRSAPAAATGAPISDVKGLVRDLLAKVKPYKMFLPPDAQKAYEKADVWAQVTDDAMAGRG